MFDWKKTVSSVAPLIGSAIGGPLGGVAVKTALSVLGVSASPNPVDNIRLLEEAVQGADPEQLRLLQEAEFKFKTDMEALGIKLEELHQADRHSAREREVKVGGWTVPAMAWFIVIGGFSLLTVILFVPVKVDDLMLGTIIGLVIGEMRQVSAYYFGSSSGQDNAASK